ncbi:NAD(P)/FAD-dependent oxidoreductase [Pseudomonas sp. CCI3.2]|uniref:NAD(P)/FAD-dependent oxidoreductase n=1 Tax=unclassified Pseudomonas TaxID=196821 RepID=UPI002AC95D9C|nr:MULTISPECIES: NAD(P)/FAD-dependent oxidoreductase [unclassified Pseudomonas]MEB0077702.1 NAD(P)/FAD-dependent oxidoreductase [Pseudomonas sp. MH10out]MEB0101304.1 NAD(P)/FAD-dependent oxidoreductase [Pseudomonas sp. CCI3.2]MEB0131411.1 NAD(P)/FAD-dependent oxidoreductase [Pseudomonas sp. CCI2.4]MEB0158421.1 NAD(P)/FAD-dependent oxidoreductase [Pseudomonas sp. AH2 (2023)]MEB0167682.1 NAD(P)/FAD-dependent oxidoreductase [Pseudomonas sp. CCC4.4]
MKQHILVIGAGFGGMWTALSATRLLNIHDRHNVEVTVLAPQAQLRVRPRLYEPDAHHLFAPIGELFDAVGVKFIKGAAQTIDVHLKQVGYSDASGAKHVLSYDKLVLASGSRLAASNTQGVAKYAFDVDQIETAVRLEDHLKSLANVPESKARNTVVVAGGGFTGIETATEMPARLRAILGEGADIEVIIVDRGEKIGTSMGVEISESIAEASAELGVKWSLKSSVVAVDENGVTLSDGRHIDAKTVVWTTGVRASSLTEQIPGERDALGRLHVDGQLKVIGQEDIFATGDVAYAATDDIGNHALMTCQHAIVLGRHAGNNVAAQILGVTPTPYSQPKYVTCLDLGAWGAVYTEGWDRQVKLIKQEGKSLKTQINTVWIYPPAANRETAWAAADPLIPIA